MSYFRIHILIFLIHSSSLSLKTSRVPSNAQAQPQMPSDVFALNVSPFVRGGSVWAFGRREALEVYRRARSNLFDLKDPNEMSPTLPVYIAASAVTPGSAESSSSSPGTQTQTQAQAQATVPSVVTVGVELHFCI